MWLIFGFFTCAVVQRRMSSFVFCEHCFRTCCKHDEDRVGWCVGPHSAVGGGPSIFGKKCDDLQKIERKSSYNRGGAHSIGLLFTPSRWEGPLPLLGDYTVCLTSSSISIIINNVFSISIIINNIVDDTRVGTYPRYPGTNFFHRPSIFLFPHSSNTPSPFSWCPKHTPSILMALLEAILLQHIVS